MIVREEVCVGGGGGEINRDTLKRQQTKRHRVG